jgi:hypothetical protein
MKLDSLPVALRGGTAALPGTGRIGDVRRNGWLYSLEHALLDSGSKTARLAQGNGQPEAPQPQAAEVAASPEQELRKQTAHAQLHLEQATRGDATKGEATRNEAKPGRAIEAQSPKEKAAPAHRAQAPARPLSAAAKGNSSDAQSAMTASATTPPSDGAAVSAWAWLSVNSTAPQSVQAGLASMQSPPAAPLGLSGAQAALAMLDTPSIGAMAAVASASPMEAGPNSQAETTDSPPPLYTRAQQSAVGSGASVLAAASSQPYGRRQLHVHVGNDGVQAWVRDADLSAAAACRVAGAFVQNARYGGPRLAALTINGKKVVDTAFSRQATPNSLTQPGEHRSQPGDLDHGN